MAENLSSEGIERFFASLCLLALPAGAAIAGIRYFIPSARGPFFPPQRVRLAPWRLMDVALVVFIFVGMDYGAASIFGLREPDRTLGIELRVQTQSEVAAGLPGGGFSLLAPLARARAAHAIEEADQAFRQVSATALVRPLQILAILFVLTRVAGGQLYQLGITLAHFPKVLAAGLLTGIVVSLLANLIYWLVLQFEPPRPHPVETLVVHSASGAVLFMILFTVLIGAPVLEELIFRGLLQPIMVNSPEVPDVVLLITLIGIIANGTFQVWQHGFLANPWPIVLLVGTGSGYMGFEWLMSRWIIRPGAARAIYATSILFAVLHLSNWPTPVPLFFMSLGVGYLGYRTQSLIGPIVAHSFFNLVTMVGLLLRV